MVKSWKDMTADEKLESMSARLDEVAAVVIELERQIRELQGGMARPKGRTRPVLKMAGRK